MNLFTAMLPWVLAFGGVLAVGLVLIGAAIVSLLRSFTPGSRARPAPPARPRLGRATIYSLGLGAAVGGAVGLLALLVLRLSPEASAVWALGTGLGVGLVAELILVLLPNRRQVEETLTAVDADGREARVVIAIPAGGVGEVVYSDNGGDVSLGARSAGGEAIASNTPVRIERVSQRVAIVHSLSESAPAANGAPTIR